MKNIYLIFLCLTFFSCAQDNMTDEPLDTPKELLGSWGLTENEKSKHPISVLKVSPTRLVISGLYFELQKVEYENFTRGAYIQTGNIYTKGPGKSGLFSAYRIARKELDGNKTVNILYLDGGEIMYGPLSSTLTFISSAYE
ncbi:MAG: hypothetical protein LBC53_07880 [Spirochaetaceae bacterium]|nr:hypothetical protein [Spirochaetaceae bacterium]